MLLYLAVHAKNKECKSVQRMIEMVSLLRISRPKGELINSYYSGGILSDILAIIF